MFKFGAVIVLLFCLQATAKVEVQYRFGKMHGLINFMSAVTGEPHQSENIKIALERSRLRTHDVDQAITNIKNLRGSLHRGFDFDNSVPSRTNGADVLTLLLQQSFYANDLKDLNERTMGLIPIGDQRKLFEALAVLEKVYDRFLWQGSESTLQQHQKNLQALAKKVNLDNLFQRASHFYDAKWPDDLNFTVGLFPIPFLKNEKTNATSSQSIGAIEEHGVLIGLTKDDTMGSFGVIFHELCHSLYGAQDIATMDRFYNYFAKNSSPYRMQAYSWFNEAMATAIGNGWVEAKARGAENMEYSWYNNETIDGYAKAIYPMTKEYLEKNKVMDKTFIDKAIEIFAKKFPDSIYNYDSLLSRINFMTDGLVVKGEQSLEVLHSQFFISKISASSPLDHKFTIEGVKTGNETALIVVSDGGQTQLKNLAKQIPFLQENIAELEKLKSGQIWSGVAADTRAYIILKIHRADQFLALLKDLKKLKKINLKSHLQNSEG